MATVTTRQAVTQSNRVVLIRTGSDGSPTIGYWGWTQSKEGDGICFKRSIARLPIVKRLLVLARGAVPGTN